MNRLIIIGASGHGRVVADTARLCGYRDIRFLDRNQMTTHCAGYVVAGRDTDFRQFVDDGTDFFAAVGDGFCRRRILEGIWSAGGRTVTLVHPAAVVSEDTVTGTGTVFMAGTVVNSGARTGRGVIVNTSASIDHDCVIGDYCHIAAGAHVCGTADIGEGTWIGAGAVVSNNISICGGCTIGAGAVVVKDITVAGIYIGVPAKRKE